jgi:dihydroneopterin aldolase
VTDQILLCGLEVFAPIGVYEHEHGIEQRLLFDVTVDFDVSKPGHSDRLEDTLDYDRMAAICREVAKDRHHELIEVVAEQIAARVLSELGVTAVQVQVSKPKAVADAETVAVRIRRTRPAV